jgi:hypothetical protein
MILVETLCVLSLFLATTACQLSPRMATPKDEIYGDGTQMYIHHRNNLSKAYEVYIDQKRVDPEVLDRNGVKISKGKHAIDIIDKNSRNILRHFDIDVEDTREKHYILCTLKSPQDFALEDRDNARGICLDNKLK